MGNPVLAQGILQGPDNSLLADNLCKDLGPRFSGKDEIGQDDFQGLGIQIMITCTATEEQYTG